MAILRYLSLPERKCGSKNEKKIHQVGVMCIGDCSFPVLSVFPAASVDLLENVALIFELNMRALLLSAATISSSEITLVSTEIIVPARCRNMQIYLHSSELVEAAGAVFL
jgi:hypothetical protein